MQMELKNMEIRHDIETQHLQTKIKLVSLMTENPFFSCKIRLQSETRISTSRRTTIGSC